MTIEATIPQRGFTLHPAENFESDYDSEYANHPPPTDSEVEIEMSQEYLLPAYNYSAINTPVRRQAPIHDINTCSCHGNHLRSHSSLQVLSSSIQQHSEENHFGAPSIGGDSNKNNQNNLKNEDNESTLLFGISSTAARDLNRQRNHLKDLGLKSLTARQHIAVAICRDISLLSILKNFFILWSHWYKLIKIPYRDLTGVRATEFFLAGLWCLVSAFLSYSILDGLMARWMVMYAVQAAIVRILSMSLFIVVVVELFGYTFNNKENEFCLTVWIFISCVLTIVYIVQSFVTSNLRLEGHIEKGQKSERRNTNGETELVIEHNNFKKIGRKVDFYNIIVFAVVPIGVASFVSMVGLVRLLLILRLEIGMQIINKVN